MESIDELVALARGTAGCTVHPSAGPPRSTPPHLSIPDDLARFFELAGGADLFSDRDAGFRLAAPEQFLQANPAILPADVYNEHRDELGTSNNWWLIAYGNNPEEAISIDLTPEFSGLCYDSFHEVHATEDSPVVARSFSELFATILNSRGDDGWWDSRESFGHAKIRPTA